jgi:hypothetical protein
MRILFLIFILYIQPLISQNLVYDSGNELIYTINNGVFYSGSDSLYILCNIKENSVFISDSDQEEMTLITFKGDLAYNKRSWFSSDILYSISKNKIRKHDRYKIYDFVYIDGLNIRLCTSNKIIFTFSDKFNYNELITILYLSYKVESYQYNDIELDMMVKINNYRYQRGLPELEPVEHISFKCSEHNNFMIKNELIIHREFKQRSKNIQRIFGAVKISENLAFNFENNNEALKAWMDSDIHNRNLLGDYTHFGISIKINPLNGKKYYTNIFMKVY